MSDSIEDVIDQEEEEEEHGIDYTAVFPFDRLEKFANLTDLSNVDSKEIEAGINIAREVLQEIAEEYNHDTANVFIEYMSECMVKAGYNGFNSSSIDAATLKFFHDLLDIVPKLSDHLREESKPTAQKIIDIQEPVVKNNAEALNSPNFVDNARKISAYTYMTSPQYHATYADLLRAKIRAEGLPERLLDQI